MRKIVLSAMFMIGGLFALTSAAWAVPIVSIDVDPGTAGIQTSLIVDLGSSFDIDVVISGVDPLAPLNAFEFDVDFSSALLTATGVSSGGFLLAPAFVVQNIVGVSTVEFAEVTLLPVGAVGAGVLATLTFNADALGTSALDLNSVILSAPFGFQIFPSAVNDGSVTVADPGGGNPIPEPSTILLFGTGLAGLIAWRRRKQ